MNRRRVLSLSTVAVLGLALLPGNAPAQEKSLKDQLIGTWTLDSIYSQRGDSPKMDTWGSGVKGSLMLSPNGRFSLFIVAANRDESASKNPRIPVGQALGYFGTYTVDESAKTLTYHIEGSTFPRWDGTDRKETIEAISATDLKVVTTRVQDRVLGSIVAHQTWKRSS
jgi:Lipocalin-like domain